MPVLIKSVAALQKAYSQNTFAAMKVSYDVYPNHIGHLEVEGCFRCHNDDVHIRKREEQLPGTVIFVIQLSVRANRI